MEEKAKVDESLTDQLLNEFINEYLLSLYELQYTEFSYDYNKFDFYFKLIDRLHPPMFLIGNSYYFNKHLILRLNTNTLHYYSSQGKEIFFNFLKKELQNSTSYLNYINRLTKGSPNVSLQNSQSTPTPSS